MQLGWWSFQVDHVAVFAVAIHVAASRVHPARHSWLKESIETLPRHFKPGIAPLWLAAAAEYGL